jgi:hypothetical protein
MRSDFHAHCGAVTQSRSIESIPDSGEFDRVGNVFIDRHPEQLTRHTIGRVFDALARLGFHGWAEPNDCLRVQRR